MAFVRYKLWDKTSNLIEADGSVHTPEQVFQKWGFAKYGDVMLEFQDEQVMCGIDSLGNLCNVFKVERADTPEETMQRVIDAMKAASNPPGDAITPEEIDQAIQEGVASI